MPAVSYDAESLDRDSWLEELRSKQQAYGYMTLMSSAVQEFGSSRTHDKRTTKQLYLRGSSEIQATYLSGIGYNSTSAPGTDDTDEAADETNRPSRDARHSSQRTPRPTCATNAFPDEIQLCNHPGGQRRDGSTRWYWCREECIAALQHGSCVRKRQNCGLRGSCKSSIWSLQRIYQIAIIWSLMKTLSSKGCLIRSCQTNAA